MRLSYRRSGVRLTLPRRKRRGFQTHVAMPSWPSPGPVNAVASYPARSTPADLTNRRQVATAAAETPAPGGTPRGTFAARAAASLALADTRPGKGDDRTLRLTSPRRQQIKQRQESNSLLVTSTTKKFVGLASPRRLEPISEARGLRRRFAQRVRPDTHPPPAHYLRLAHTPQWTAQRTALSPITAHRHVEARNLWIVPHPIVALCLPCATPRE